MQSGRGRASVTQLSNDIAMEGAAEDGRRIQHSATPVVPLSLQTINPKVRSSVSFNQSSSLAHCSDILLLKMLSRFH